MIPVYTFFFSFPLYSEKRKQEKAKKEREKLPEENQGCIKIEKEKSSSI